MALPWGLVVFLIGIAWGLLAPGRQGKLRLIFNGLLIGAILALVFILLGHTIDNNPLGLGDTWGEYFLAFLVISLLFALGVWVGDLVEGMARGRRRDVA